MQTGTAANQDLMAYVPTPWDQLPDLGLYMDQVITYTERQCRALYPAKESVLTPAMINNYVKCELVKRPNGKKYDRIHLAQLMMLCTLKQAASLDEMKRLLVPREGQSVEELYASFCKMQSEVFQYLSSREQNADAMQYAIEAAAFRILCARQLEAEKPKAQKTEGKTDIPVNKAAL